MEPSLFFVSLLANLIFILVILFSRTQVAHKAYTKPPQYEQIDPIRWYESHPVDFHNASAVFNTVNGAMKLKDMNLFPVGVSFIPAYIPSNTLLYHSTNLPEIPSGYDWIAMDYEFSYDFAVFDRAKKKPHPHKRSQQPIKAMWGRPKNNAFLYTFRNTKPLDKLIYLDGASAAKTRTGEMDQQLILSRQKDIYGRVDEYEAAEKICEWGREFGLQGVVRLEVGFEVIICDFHDGIELVANVSLNNVTDLAHFPGEKVLPQTPLEEKREKLIDDWDLMHGFEHARAGAVVNDGDSRIMLDFSKMVTPLNQTWLNPDPYLRRINNLSEEAKEALILDISHTLRDPVDPFGKTDWQLLTQRLEDKFAPMLVQLHTAFSVFENKSKTEDLGEALEEVVAFISKITFNFVRRYSDNNLEDEKIKKDRAFVNAIQDYVYHTFPLAARSDGLIYSSVYRVAYEVILTVFDLFYTSRVIMADIYVHPSDKNFEEFKATILAKKGELTELLGSLRWSIFTQCSELCQWDEVCYAPTWGIGPINWGANDKYMEFDGERYRIPRNLQCINYKDAGVL